MTLQRSRTQDMLQGHLSSLLQLTLLSEGTTAPNRHQGYSRVEGNRHQGDPMWVEKTENMRNKRFEMEEASHEVGREGAGTAMWDE